MPGNNLWFWDTEILADFINEEIINLFMPGYRGSFFHSAVDIHGVIPTFA